ncbi:MAG: hypothetical protein ACYCZX_06220 [Rhodospirillaceae bacterium]
MPGDAFAAERGWLRAVATGLVVFQAGSLAGEARAGQSQGQIPVSAFVVVSSSIAATVRLGLAAENPTQNAGAPATAGEASAPSSTPAINTPKPLCTTIAVSCTGRSPMRVSVDEAANGAAGDSSGDVHECSTQASNNLSLCASGPNAHNALGVTIEY